MTSRLLRTLPFALLAACTGDISSSDAGLRDAGPRDAAVATTVDAPGTDARVEVDGGPLPPTMAGVVVAVGRGGRSTISCDDGRTWIENRIETAPTVRCWGQPNNAEPQFLDAEGTMPNPDYLECDHHTSSVTGLVFHGGAFFRSIGWGTPGRTQRSVDGVTWSEPSAAFATTYLGLVAFDDALIAMGTPQPFMSTDEGGAWTATSGSLGWESGHVRSATRSSYGPMGSIVFITDMGIWYSADRGATFHGPEASPCDGRSFASGNGVTVLTGADGTMCTTVDGGATWQTQRLGTSFTGSPVWNGTAFHAWGNASGGGAHFVSANGVAWTTTMVPSANFGAVGATASGAFVATNGIWNGGYENQRFFRSDDGETWEMLATDGTAFVPGHPISHFASGRVLANAYCPAE